MNKLKKPLHRQLADSNVVRPGNLMGASSNVSHVESRTMMYARAFVPTTTANAKATGVAVPPVIRTMTKSEQYWAARALTAEAYLSARMVHQSKLVDLSNMEEEKRIREMAALKRSHDERHAKLEMLVIILLACLVALIFATLYVVVASFRHSPSTRWATPHITIPILSPFASVVEHETSAINTKLMTVGVVVLGCLAYACFRHWISQHAQRR